VHFLILPSVVLAGLCSYTSGTERTLADQAGKTCTERPSVPLHRALGDRPKRDESLTATVRPSVHGASFAWLCLFFYPVLETGFLRPGGVPSRSIRMFLIILPMPANVCEAEALRHFSMFCSFARYSLLISPGLLPFLWFG
jgi:hypothetical protein